MKKVTFFHKLIATGFGTGYSPIAPGTAGALLACGVWLVFSNYLDPQTLRLITLLLILIFTILGVRSANVMQTVWGHDPSRVVVDEMVGMWITLLAAPPKIISPNHYLWYLLAAFILFRFFDIFKPFGIRRMEKFPGGWGVMMDDVLAGLYGFLILGITRWIIS